MPDQETNSPLYDIIFKQDENIQILLEKVAERWFEKIKHLPLTERIVMQHAIKGKIADDVEWKLIQLNQDLEVEQRKIKKV